MKKWVVNLAVSLGIVAVGVFSVGALGRICGLTGARGAGRLIRGAVGLGR